MSNRGRIEPARVERLETEELPDDVAVESCDWYESTLAEAVEARSPKPAAADVEATPLAATRSVAVDEGTAGEVFDAIRGGYEAVGWAGEWRRHHQGGAAGFAGREWIATPDSSATVRLPMAYAWNPTVEGAKSEDTVLVEADGYEMLTADDWPTLSVDAVGYDETFERPAVLERG